MSGSSQQQFKTAPPVVPPSTNGHGGGWRGGGGLPTHRVPRGLAAVAVALIVGGSAVGAWLYTTAGAKVSVVEARVAIPAGHTISRADLTTVPVSGPIVAVAGNHLDSLLGQTAAVPILPGTPVQRAMVSSAPAVPAGSALVGVSVPPGDLPSAGLAPGEHVQVLQLPPKGGTLPGANAAAPASAVLADSALVFDVRADPSTQGGTLLTLVVPAGQAFGVSAASAAGQIALVQVGP